MAMSAVAQGATERELPQGRWPSCSPDELQALPEPRPAAYVPSGTLEWDSQRLPIGPDGLLAGGLAADRFAAPAGMAATQRRVR